MELWSNTAARKPRGSARWAFESLPKLFALLASSLILAEMLVAAEAPRHIPVAFKPDDIIATGNEWIALPTIRAGDGALTSFNVLSMRDRGLLQVVGDSGAPVLEPYFLISGKTIPLRELKWELLEYWIPVAHLTADGVEVTLTYCAPPGSRAAFLRMTMTNRRSEGATATLGLKASWGALNRVTYTPVELHGTRAIGEAPWVDSAEVFSFVTHDTQFAWLLIHPNSVGQVSVPPLTLSPALDAHRSVALAAGETTEANFVLGPGIEEFSAPHNAKALRELLDRKDRRT